jgi:L,D-peptidoglycan transpeptidase YkuD (ErfK/YbiS/YcfS/YnhG family)
MRAALLALVLLMTPLTAFAQRCPAQLASARKLVLVVADDFTTTQATAQLFQRNSTGEQWRAVSDAEPALIGKGGTAWSYFFRAFAQKGEPIKVEGDKRLPAGFYRIGKSFGTLPPNRTNYLHVTEGMTCVDDVTSPAYNTITTRAKVGWNVRGENMWRAREYRRGLLVDYPTNAKARAGSCIFIHVRLAGVNGTGGCVALPQARVEALQDFVEDGGAALAVVPRAALSRFNCLPAN